MEGLQKKTLTTKRSFKYTYYTSRSGQSNSQHPALFFIHGFPDSARLWTDVVAKLGDLPNKIIVIDCLGYAGTDKPEDVHQYAYDGQAADHYEILAAENAERTIIVGHDWGSAIAQRTYLHNRELFCGVILVNVAYLVPSDEKFDLAAVNELTTKIFGYPQYAYWELFTAPDGAEVIDGHLEKFWEVLHGDDNEWMKKMFCTSGAMRAYLLGPEEVPLKSYAKEPRWKDDFMKQFKSDGINSPLQMYRSTATNVQFDSDLKISRDKLAIEVPILFIICTGDAVCRRELMIPAQQRGLVPDLKEVVVESAHWSPMEKPDELAAHMRDFLNERYAKG